MHFSTTQKQSTVLLLLLLLLSLLLLLLLLCGGCCCCCCLLSSSLLSLLLLLALMGGWVGGGIGGQRGKQNGKQTGGEHGGIPPNQMHLAQALKSNPVVRFNDGPNCAPSNATKATAICDPFCIGCAKWRPKSEPKLNPQKPPRMGSKSAAN